MEDWSGRGWARRRGDADRRSGSPRPGRRLQLHPRQRGRLPDRLRPHERGEGLDHEAPDGPAERALRPRRSAGGRRHDERREGHPGRGPRQAARGTLLGGVSQGKLVTTDNYYALFNGILNPKQLEGLRLLLTPFPQQQFNATADRRSEHPSLGVACFDCHQNGHTNGANHLVGDIRPQEFRHRIETTTLRGVNIQRLFGSQRALKTVEDFTEFEQRAAYFDGDPVVATKKGVNVLERG